MRVNDKQVYNFTYNLHYLMNGRDGEHYREGISQEALAKQLGVAQTTVSSWVNALKFPRESTVKAIADFFNVTVDELLNVPLELYDLKGFGILTDSAIDEKAKNDPYAEALEMRRQRDDIWDRYNRIKPFAEYYMRLNAKGQHKVVDYARDLSENPKYRK